MYNFSVASREKEFIHRLKKEIIISLLMDREWNSSFNIYNFFEEYNWQESRYVYACMLTNEDRSSLRRIISLWGGECTDDLRKEFIIVMLKIYDNLVVNFGVRAIKNKSADDYLGLYSLFPYSSIDKVNEALRYLSIEEINVLKSKYGNDFMHPVSNFSKIYPSDYVVWAKNIGTKIHKLLENKGKFFSSVYGYFNYYSSELIDYVLSTLDECDILLLKKRFGDDLKQPYDYEKLAILSLDEMKKLSKIKTKIGNKLIRLNKKSRWTIYDYFKKKGFSKDEVDVAILLLPSSDRNWLYKLYGTDLSGMFQKSGGISGLAEDESSRLVNICNRIHYFLKKERDKGEVSNLSLEFTKEQYKALVEWVESFVKDNNYDRTISGEVRDRMILYLYLGIGIDCPLDIDLIARSFDMDHREVRSIIIRVFNDYKRKGVSYSSMRKGVISLIWDIIDINKSIYRKSIPVVGPDISLKRVA